MLIPSWGEKERATKEFERYFKIMGKCVCVSVCVCELNESSHAFCCRMRKRVLHSSRLQVYGFYYLSKKPCNWLGRVFEVVVQNVFSWGFPFLFCNFHGIIISQWGCLSLAVMDTMTTSKLGRKGCVAAYTSPSRYIPAGHKSEAQDKNLEAKIDADVREECLVWCFSWRGQPAFFCNSEPLA